MKYFISSALAELDIDSVEMQIEEVEVRILNVRQQKISGDNIYQFLLYFDKLYDKFTDAEKKTFLSKEKTMDARKAGIKDIFNLIGTQS